ncbi:unnamed protein product [Clonostachys chloroleuca]|uniref:Uncharacterized protein n=1 Tax=Clonostachys chloroleuca TaxID=1926264 RepID=A0AA35LYA8_9HYPO|nr:unnamed protein product [Clonostachys chloroleuca]
MVTGNSVPPKQRESKDNSTIVSQDAGLALPYRIGWALLPLDRVFTLFHELLKWGSIWTQCLRRFPAHMFSNRLENLEQAGNRLSFRVVLMPFAPRVLRRARLVESAATHCARFSAQGRDTNTATRLYLSAAARYAGPSS